MVISFTSYSVRLTTASDVPHQLVEPQHWVSGVAEPHGLLAMLVPNITLLDMYKYVLQY